MSKHDPQSSPGRPPEGSAPPEKKSWRGKSAAAPTVVRHRWQRDWMKQQDVDVRRRSRNYRAKLIVAGGAFVALVVVFVIYLLGAATKAPLITAAVTNYAFPLPPNAFAQEDVAQFKLLRDNLTVFPMNDSANDWNQPWSTPLNDLSVAIETALQDDNYKNKVLTIYISAHGAVKLDENGQPRACLLPPYGDAADPEKWLPVDELLRDVLLGDNDNAMVDVDGYAQRKKLLILDAHRLGDDWSLGQLYNGFAEALEQSVKQVVDPKTNPNVAVLFAAGPGQNAWVSPERGTSTFGYYVAQGLGGQADEAGDGNGKITLAELASYVRSQADAWARQNRADRQTPDTLPLASDSYRDWLVAETPRTPFWSFFARWRAGDNAEQPASPTAEAKQPDLSAYWEARERFQQGDAVRQDPLAWQEFERRLLWGEQLALAGSAYDDAEGRNADALKRLQNQLTRKPAVKRENLASIPLTTSFSPGGAEEGLRAAVEVWNAVLKTPDTKTIASELGNLPAGANADRFSELCFTRLLNNHLNKDDWSKPAIQDAIRDILSLREQAEGLAAPADRRTVPWIAPLVDNADSLRRLAEDQLFVGGEAGAKSSQDHADDAQQLYEQAKRLSKKVAEAYHERDEAASQAVYFAQWFGRRLPPALDADKLSELRGDLDPLLKQEFIPLIDANLALTEVLSAPSPAWSSHPAEVQAQVDAQIARIDAPRGEVQKHRGNILTSIGDECVEINTPTLGDRQFDLDNLRRISAVLDIPWVSPSMRADFQAKLAAVSRRRQQEFDHPTTAIEASNDSERPVNHYLERLEDWGLESHPVVVLLNSLLPDEQKLKAGSSDTSLMKLALLGSDVRAQLGRGSTSIDSAASSLANHDLEAIRSSTAPVEPVPRPDLAKADYMLRATAALRPDPEAQESPRNPISCMQYLDLAELFRWHARRTLDDFYGPAAGSGYFFVEASENYLQEAQEWMKSACASDVALRTAEDGLLAQRRTAADHFQDQNDSNPVLPNVPELVGSGKGLVEHHLELAPPAGLPPGVVSLFIADQSHGGLRPRLSSLEKTESDLRLSAPTTPAAAPEDAPPGQRHAAHDYLVNLDDLGEADLASADIRAIAYFRGHVHAKPIDTGSTDIEYKTPDYEPPRVTVRASERDEGELMFIFDCSGSMKEPEGSLRRKRIDIARSALFGTESDPRLFDLLAASGTYRVGLRIFAHRVGLVGSNNDVVIRRDKVPIPDPILKLAPEQWDREKYLAELQQVRPGTDVDRVLPIGRFTARELEQTHALFLKLLPYGITPLYYSIAKSLEDDFPPGGNAAERRILVLTDGEDTQYFDDGLDDQDRVMLDELKAAFANRNANSNDRVRLDIVGFRITGGSNDLKSLAEETGGRFYNVQQSDDLIQTLKNALGLNNFSVVRTSTPGKEYDSKEYDPKDFNTWLAITDHPLGTRLNYRAQVHTTGSPVPADFELEGGEDLALVLTDNGRRLVHTLPSDFGGWERDHLEHVADPHPDSNRRELYIAAHLPEVKGSGFVFPVSVRNQDHEQFSPRPLEVWAEIRPVMPRGAGDPPVYTFYDLQFENRRPVPVLQFAVPRWPTQPGIAEAEVNLWCRFHPMERRDGKDQFETYTVGDVPRVKGRRYPLVSRPGVEFDVAVDEGQVLGDDEWDVVVTVYLPEGAEQTEPIRVEMDPPPVGVLHRYFNNHRKVVHRFHYDKIASESRLDNYRVRFTPLERWKEGAVALERPLRVPIPPR